MTVRPAVTQQQQPLSEDVTLMSTTDLNSNITHSNDAFARISGYSLEERTGAPWSGVVKNRCKNGDHYWVKANVCPIKRQGPMAGYMSIRTAPTRDEIASVEPLYKALNQGTTHHRLFKGLVLNRLWSGMLATWSVRRRIVGIFALLYVLFFVCAWFHGQRGMTLLGEMLTAAGVMAFGYIMMVWQITSPIEHVARQALDIATGEKQSVKAVQRVDEIGRILSFRYKTWRR